MKKGVIKDENGKIKNFDYNWMMNANKNKQTDILDTAEKDIINFKNAPQ